MAVFISYSSKDKSFVDKLAIRLVKERIKIWIDRWEINVGDSLIDKIQNALTESSFLIVVLSKHSVESEWCRKELNSGLIREIESKSVVILPVLIEDCTIPPFLREKKYADFKNDFEKGFEELMPALQSLFAEYMGKSLGDEYNTDYALDWGIKNDSYYFNIDAVTFYKEKPFSILSQTKFTGNSIATERWILQSSKRLDWLMKEAIVEMCNQSEETMSILALLQNDKPYQNVIVLADKNLGTEFEMEIRVRILGQDTGKDTVYDYPSIFRDLKASRKERLQ